MSVELIDNFLQKTEFESLKYKFLQNTFPYYYNDFKVSVDQDDEYQFTHIFVSDGGQINSDYLYLLNPVFKILNVQSLERVKLNLTMRDTNIKKYGFHIDTDLDCNTAILYLNTNNGKTIFENEKQINSIENRLIRFPSNLKHTGTTHTDSKYRLILNINYV